MTVQPLVGALTVSEAADMAKVSEWTIRKEVRIGNLEARRIGKCVRFWRTNWPGGFTTTGMWPQMPTRPPEGRREPRPR